MPDLAGQTSRDFIHDDRVDFGRALRDFVRDALGPGRELDLLLLQPRQVFGPSEGRIGQVGQGGKALAQGAQ